MIYSISFDPERDTRDRLTQVADGYGADPEGWLFLRGDEETVKQVTQGYKIMAVKDPSGNFIHSNLFTLVDKDGRVRKIYNANDMDEVVSGKLVNGIVDDMEKLAR
jgi:protein SCO1